MRKASKKSLHIACSCDDGENLNFCCKSGDIPTAKVIAEGTVPLGKLEEGLRDMMEPIRKAEPSTIQYSYSNNIPRDQRFRIAETVGAAMIH